MYEQGKDVDGTGAMLPLSVFPGGFQCPRRCLVSVHAFVCCLLMRYHFVEAVDVRARRDGDEDGKLGFSFTVS